MQFTHFCRDFDLVAKYVFSQAPSCINFLPPGSASDSRTGATGAPLRVIISPSILEGFVNSIFQGWSGVGTELAHRKVG